MTEVELEPGQYGAFVYLDLNAGFGFEKNFIGMPKEPYAFSGPFNKLRMPKFKDCMFVVGKDGATITVGLQEGCIRESSSTVRTCSDWSALGPWPGKSHCALPERCIKDQLR